MLYFAIAVFSYFVGFFTHKYVVNKTRDVVSAVAANVKVDVDKISDKVTESNTPPQS